MLTLPSSLKRGDTIGIVCPSDPIADIDAARVERAYAFLRSKGFRIEEAPHVRSTSIGEHSIQERLDDLHAFIARPDIRCIMSFWGGRNATDLLDRLDYTLIAQHPKIIVGYSDITTLLLSAHAHTGVAMFVGPAAVTFTKRQQFEYTWDAFAKLCLDGTPAELSPAPRYADFSPSRDLEYQAEAQPNRGPILVKPGVADGPAVGGHALSILSLIGTQHAPTFDGRVVFLEFSEEESARTSTTDFRKI